MPPIGGLSCLISLVYSTGGKPSMVMCTQRPSKGLLHAGYTASLLADMARYEKNADALIGRFTAMQQTVHYHPFISHPLLPF